jgi:hypothetical protein
MAGTANVRLPKRSENCMAQLFQTSFYFDRINIENGAIVRWHCPFCNGETSKHSVRVAVYHRDHFVGAVCPLCLQDSKLRRQVPTLPTFEAFQQAIEADEAEWLR